MFCCFGKPPKPTPQKPRTSPSSSSPLTPQIHAQLPGCDLLHLLGEGTYGTVVLVRERYSRSYYAVKIMSKSQLASEEQFESLTLESQILKSLGPHPFIIRCYSAFQTEQAVVLVLEYLSGGDLYDLLKVGGCLSENELKFYLAEVVVGVGELHKEGFVFRDLKLENILLDAEGHVRLTDFGLAERERIGEGEATGDGVKGTAIYWAPELVGKGKVEKGMMRVVDWWALGVLTYVLLTGRAPFGLGAVKDREELLRRIREVDVDVDKDEKLEDVSAVCKDLIKRLLVKNPHLRLGSARKDVQEVMEHEFFDGVDWERITEFELKPPRQPPLKPPQGVQQEAARIAQELCSDKLGRKYGKTRGRKKSKVMEGMLGDEHYRKVNVTQRSPGRISIGLDFENKNNLARKKTWAEEDAGDLGKVMNA